ncbi:MAG: hypothetical protein H7222_12805 [Methylotenera sp.]|nr:hypothetical protein [Oligoflexia bacterium]
MKVMILCLAILSSDTAFGEELTGSLRASFLNWSNLFHKAATMENEHPCGSGSISSQPPKSSWVAMSPAEAQCTPGAEAAGAFAHVKISSYSKTKSFTIEPLSARQVDAVANASKTHTSADYIGNGPIFMKDSKPNGYVKSGGKVISPIDCVNYRSNSGNLGKENSVFVRYHARKRPYTSTSGYESEWKYRVVSTEFLCAQLQPVPYVDYMTSKGIKNVESFLGSNKKWEKDGEDLVEGGQIDFAMQSGPGVLRDGENKLEGYNSAARFRSYIGVNNDGEPVVVEADGSIGSYCLGQYLKARGIRDLLHRDSEIADAAFRGPDGKMTGYPTPNPGSAASSLLMISP